MNSAFKAVGLAAVVLLLAVVAVSAEGNDSTDLGINLVSAGPVIPTVCRGACEYTRPATEFRPSRTFFGVWSRMSTGLCQCVPPSRKKTPIVVPAPAVVVPAVVPTPEPVCHTEQKCRAERVCEWEREWKRVCEWHRGRMDCEWKWDWDFNCHNVETCKEVEVCGDEHKCSHHDN